MTEPPPTQHAETEVCPVHRSGREEGEPHTWREYFIGAPRAEPEKHCPGRVVKIKDEAPLVDLERWGRPGALYLQTIRSANPDLPGWIVYDSRGVCRLRRSTEEQARTWLIGQGYDRKAIKTNNN